MFNLFGSQVLICFSVPSNLQTIGLNPVDFLNEDIKIILPILLNEKSISAKEGRNVSMSRSFYFTKLEAIDDELENHFKARALLICC